VESTLKSVTTNTHPTDKSINEFLKQVAQLLPRPCQWRKSGWNSGDMVDPEGF